MVRPTLPASWYTSAAMARRERDAIFARNWALFGPEHEVSRPGTWAAHTVNGWPVVVLRDRGGDLRAFHNHCRHRAAALLPDGAGSCPARLVCPYHGWTYDCRGRLAGVPDRRSFDGVDLSDRNLVELPALEFGGMIWSGLAPSAAFDLDRFLAGLGPELASYGFDRHLHYARRTLVRRMNWKMVIDTFLESYHFGVLHPHTVHPLFFANVGLFEPFGPHLREVYPRRTIVELKDRPEADWDLVTHTAIIYVLFPSTVIVMQADHAEIWRIFPDPERSDTSVVHLDFYIPEPAETDSAHRHWDRNLDLVLRTVEEEDFPTGEGIQAGFRAGAQTEVVYGRNEPALQHWQRMVTEMLEDGAGGR